MGALSSLKHSSNSSIRCQEILHRECSSFNELLFGSYTHKDSLNFLICSRRPHIYHMPIKVRFELESKRICRLHTYSSITFLSYNIECLSRLVKVDDFLALMRSFVIFLIKFLVCECSISTEVEQYYSCEDAL